MLSISSLAWFQVTWSSSGILWTTGVHLDVCGPQLLSVCVCVFVKGWGEIKGVTFEAPLCCSLVKPVN